jgi:hypothetical protein
MTVTFVLILFYFGDGRAVTSVPGFPTRQECESAGKAVQEVVGGNYTSSRFVCVQQSNPG